MAGAHHSTSRRQERLCDDDERDAHRLARARDDHAMAGVPRHLRRRSCPVGITDPRRASPLVYCQRHRRCADMRVTSGAIHVRANGGGRAEAAFAAQDPRVRVLFDYGGGESRIRGAPAGLRWRVLDVATRWDGHDRTSSVRTARSRRAPSTRYRPFRSSPTPRSGPADRPSFGERMGSKPPYDWTAVPAANGIAFETPAFSTDTDDRRSCEPQPRIEVDCPGHRSSGDRHRGPSRPKRGGVRDLRLLAELQPDPDLRRQLRSTRSPTISRPIVRTCRRAVHARADPHRPDRSHVPGRNPLAHRDLRSRR